MGSRELLAGLLWRCRAGVRVEGSPLRAGHGMADAAYRPPALPYASVVGPLTIELEPDRDPPRAVVLPVQAPGYLAGAARLAGDLVPPPGPLSLRFDGDTLASTNVDFGALAGQSFTAEGVGPLAATTVEQALHAGTFTVNGATVTDPARLAELDAVTARWDRGGARLVVASGRRGVLTGTDMLERQPSAVEAVAPVAGVAAALGLGAPSAVRAPGRVVRHRRPTPTAVAVDVRVDLWAGTQSELASILDAWTRTTATRGQLLVRPAVLAEDVSPGDTSVRLLSPAEPMARTTLVLLDPVDAQLPDRITGRAARLAPGAQVQAGELLLTGDQRAELDFFDLPAVPVAWAPSSPTAHGYAATIGLRAAPGVAGQTVRVLTVLGQGRTALRLDVAFVDAQGAELRASAMRADAGSFVPVSATVSTQALEAGLEVHIALDSRRGTLTLAVDGDPVSDGGLSPAGPPVAGHGMRLVLGPPSGSPGNASLVAVRHVHLHGAPVGPPDPRLRLAAAPASAWSPGDPFVLARSSDGVTTSGDAGAASGAAAGAPPAAAPPAAPPAGARAPGANGVVAAVVLGVQGDRVLLDRPVQAPFPRAGSIAYARSEFFSQRLLRRSDDLMNQLFRMSAEYRISTVLDETDPGVSAPLVETVEVALRDFARMAAELAGPGAQVFPVRPAARAPGTTAIFTTNPPRSNTPAPPESTEESSNG